MKKLDMLPIIAAVIIALLVVPTGAFAATPVSNSAGLAKVVTIPEDDLKDNMGVMVLGLEPETNLLLPTGNWYTDSTCATPVTTLGVTVGAEIDPLGEPWLGITEGNVAVAPVVYYQHLTTGAVCVAHYFMPDWPKDIQPGWDLLSQHKVLATLNGVPTTPDYLLCEIVEKEKAKIPPQSTKPVGKRQFTDEVLKTTLTDVTSNFWCKFRWIKPGVGVLDVYFVGPHVYNFIADHMLIVTVGYKVNRSTIWASELQDICILGWSMGHESMALGLFPPYSISAGNYYDIYWSWDNPLGPFVSCDEAAAWQLAWIFGGWGWSEN